MAFEFLVDEEMGDYQVNYDGFDFLVLGGHPDLPASFSAGLFDLIRTYIENNAPGQERSKV